MTEQRYKLTEIGKIPEGWEVVSVLKGLGKKKFKVGKIKQLNYKEIGKIPVVDQGNNYIAGYSDDEEKAYKGDLPVIIFGDHTRIIKYIDFSFIIGADGVKVLLPDRDIFCPKFFYYALLNLQVESRGYNRHFSILKEKILPLPPLPEQKKIAEILSTADEDIQKTDEIIAKTQELKKGMMQQLLTRGIGHTRFKKTEIGEIPEEWEVVRLGDVAELRKNKTIKDVSEIAFIPMGLIPDTETYVNYKMVPISEVKSSTYCEEGDILLAKITPSVENGKQGIVPKIPTGFVKATTEVFPLNCKEEISNIFLFYILKLLKFRNILINEMTGSTGRQRVPKDTVTTLLIPLPLLLEQQKIAEILSTIDEKIEIERKRKKKLEELKKGLMQDLLTGEVRVKAN